MNNLARRLAQASAERVALTKRLFEVQEEERRALARDLHNEFGQCLTASIAFASSIKARASDRPDLATDADAVIRTAKRKMMSLREALAQLRSQYLEEVSLEASLVHLVAGWNAQAAPSALVHLDLLGDLDTVPQPVSTDDGGGDPSRFAAASGHGILGVQERVAAFGGSVLIRTLRAWCARRPRLEAVRHIR